MLVVRLHILTKLANSNFNWGKTEIFEKRQNLIKRPLILKNDRLKRAGRPEKWQGSPPF